jgi:N-acetylmuramoyl-L-alanine amidase
MLRWLLFTAVLTCFKSIAQTNSILPNYLAGKTIGPLPFLEYGLGDDRLGGAKIGYLDTSILVKVIDSVKDDYKVRLSRFHEAWMPKSSFIPDTSLKVFPYYLTGSWKVYGDEKYDYVTINLSERLPYRSMQRINPTQVVVDIFGATSNTNWITQLTTVKEIVHVSHEQVEDDVFRVIINTRHSQHWGYAIYYEEKKLVIRLKRQPEDTRLKKLKIMVDAGHGGENEGAKGKVSGIAEKDYTLKMALELQKALKKEKATVVMTRDKDTSLSMVERIEMARREDPDILLSIHLNSSSRDSISGTSTYYRYIGFRPLTQYVLQRMKELKLNDFGNIGSFNFTLSGPTEYPNCLVEVAFLSNEDDEKKILDPKFHKKVAIKIVDGIKDWLRSLR